MDLKALIQGINQIAEDKKIEAAKVLEAIEGALAAAYKKEYLTRGAVVKAKLDAVNGELSFKQVKEVVDETTVRIVEGEEEEEELRPAPLRGEPASQPGGQAKEGDEEAPMPRYNPERHLLVPDAKKIKKDAKLGDEIELPLETHTDFGRIAAQTAKQVIIQKIREAERDSIISEFKNKEGQVVSGIIQRFERGNVFIDLGRATGIMFPNECIPGEYYKNGERLRFYVLAVQTEGRTTGIVLSRAHPKFVSKLFEMEVPVSYLKWKFPRFPIKWWKLRPLPVNPGAALRLQFSLMWRALTQLGLASASVAPELWRLIANWDRRNWILSNGPKTRRNLSVTPFLRPKPNRLRYYPKERPGFWSLTTN